MLHLARASAGRTSGDLSPTRRQSQEQGMTTADYDPHLPSGHAHAPEAGNDKVEFNCYFMLMKNLEKYVWSLRWFEQHD